MEPIHTLYLLPLGSLAQSIAASAAAATAFIVFRLALDIFDSICFMHVIGNSWNFKAEVVVLKYNT